MLPPLSLVIPTYNRADLIGETLVSALAQTVPFHEIVVVDDGSTDDTVAVLAQFGDRIRVIRGANHGVQAARNTGVRSTTTPLVALCDSDDLLAPDMAASAAQWLAQHPDTDIWFCNFENFSAVRTDPDKFSQAPANYFEGAAYADGTYFDIPDLYARNAHFQPFFSSGVVFTRSFFDAIGGYDSSFRGVGAEDWEFTLRAIAMGRLAACTKTLARIRRHEGNDSANSMRMSLGEIQILEHGIAHHSNAAQHTRSLRAAIDRRLEGVFNAAFAAGDFALAAHSLQRLSDSPTSAKSRLKQWICKQPAPLARLLWRISQ